MTREELLKELVAKLETGEITKEEVAINLGIPRATATPVPMAGADTNILEEKVAPSTQSGSPHGIQIPATKIFYVLGGIIVILGIVFLVAQIWDVLSSFARIAITFGLGVLMTLIGSLLLSAKPGEYIGSVFHIIGGLLLPVGSIVLLNEMVLLDTSPWPAAIVFTTLSVFFLALASVHKTSTLTFFTIAYSTISAYLLLTAALEDMYYVGMGEFIEDLYVYLTMAIGASYILLAHSFRNTWDSRLVGSLFFFGSAGFLGAAFFEVTENPLWHLIYPLFAIGGIALSILLHSRLILGTTTLAIITYLAYITGEYFADSVGWPISLVVLGFMFIGMGYASLMINKEYLKK